MISKNIRLTKHYIIYNIFSSNKNVFSPHSMMSCQCYQCVETPNTRSNLSLVTVYQLFIQRSKIMSVGIKISKIIYEIYSKVTLKIRLLVPAVVRECTLSMWEGGPEGFTNFSKKFS